MSFTIKCNKCGNEQTFKNRNSEWKEIEIVVTTRGYMGSVIDEVSIWCENPKCNNNIDIKY